MLHNCLVYRWSHHCLELLLRSRNLDLIFDEGVEEDEDDSKDDRKATEVKIKPTIIIIIKLTVQSSLGCCN